MNKEPSEELKAKWDAAHRALGEAMIASRDEMGTDDERGLIPSWFIELLTGAKELFIVDDEPSEEDWFKGIK